MSKFTKINCPMCGKALIRLGVCDEVVNDEGDKEIFNEYWCDDCDADITIATNDYTEKDLELENF